MILHDADSRKSPARVHPVHASREEWVVVAPDVPFSDSVDAKTFAGAAALTMALTYAYERYGSVVYLSR